MKIEINKDFGTEYKDEFWKGFSGEETLCIAIAGTVAMGVVLALHFKLGIAPGTAVYFGVPASIPVLLTGFYKYQGNRNIITLIKDMYSTEKTKRLTMAMMEAKRTRVFRMRRKR